MNSIEYLNQLIEYREKHEKLRYFYAENKPVHQKQLDYHSCQKRLKINLSGNRCGKTVAIAIELIITALGIKAYDYIQDWPQEIANRYYYMIKEEKQEIWAVSLSSQVQRDILQAEILTWLPKSEIDYRNIKMISGTRDSIENGVIDLLPLKNGNVIGFKYCEQGREKFQGSSKNLIVFDEEPPEDIYKECILRTLDCKGKIIGAMTPLKGITFIYDDIYMNDKKPLEKQDKEVYCVQWEWKDNPFLSKDEIQRLESTLSDKDLEARKFGRFVVPGKTVFDIDIILNMKIYEPKILYNKYMVWKDYNPNHCYVLGGDVAEGIEQDASCLVILNRTTFSIDAVFHSDTIDSDLLAYEAVTLAEMYGNCMAAIELNNNGLVTNNTLKKHYNNIYMSKVFDKRTNETREKVGWLTSNKTRPLVVSGIQMAIRDGLKVPWNTFREEALNFQVIDGKPQGRVGKHDDTIMACGIACAVHNEIPMFGGKVITPSTRRSEGSLVDSDSLIAQIRRRKGG